MIISDISHLEVATEENSVVGGLAVATSNASAYANGPSFAGSNTSTYTSASYNPGYYGYYYPYYQPSYSASSGANSSSSAQ